MKLIALYGLLTLTFTLFAPQEENDEHAAARPLFLLHCASCHGEKGDGKGTTDLDRAARSFMDGGFSFGNTPEALFRTLTTGIPGTPMPGFDGALTEDQRRAVAAYVVTLGPPITKVDDEQTVMHVTDRPRVVRGMLPPIAEGADVHTRGLLIGLKSGQTFEYRADDVRLLGVRQGGFVKRQDWTGRGGAELAPLGKVVHLIEGGKPGAAFASATSRKELRARLAGTWIEGDEAGLRYRLLDENDKPIAWIRETVRSVGTSIGSGFARRFVIRAIGAPVSVMLRERTPEGEYQTSRIMLGESLYAWTVAQRPDGLFSVRGMLRAIADPATPVSIVAATPDEDIVIESFAVTTFEWNEQSGTELVQGLR